MNNLNNLLKLLLAHEIDFVLIGGFAGVVHGSTQVTRDLDICVFLTPAQVEKLRTILKDLHPRHRMNSNFKPSFLTEPKDLTALRNLCLETDLGILDVISEVTEVGDFDQVKRNSVEIDLFGYKCKVISVDALIKVKEKLGRPKDKLVVAELKAMSIQKSHSKRSNQKPPSYFALSRRELKDALERLRTQSSEVSDYDLSYSYDKDLNELPEKPEDMNAYADVLIAFSRIEMEKSESERTWLQIANSLGMAGSLKKMTGRFEDAERLLKYSLYIIELTELPPSHFVQQSIRLYDVWKRMGLYDAATQGLEEIISRCSKDKSIFMYLDVALQHLGKVQYSSGQIKPALHSFQKALELRLKKNDRNLIDSSQAAIEICQRQLAMGK